ncbi:hypothetical protein SLH49_08080 [Cognatiyoonia sp. IB215446]|uniref:imm11 family protein n=1 Tax=Cognatiyoonia sp. IB215446 TaxID=3097355 RepID=UPI002A171307|nr:DUF1629 domain-containing protein [Cognatiyoonia sp. IB215446]MDX8347941.1 hypothetical protein [Cognatiyoonia sp. IB215446]
MKSWKQAPTSNGWTEILTKSSSTIELLMGGRFVKLKSGRPLKPDHMPTKVQRVDPNRKKVPLLDVENWCTHFFVNQIFKDILEELEPDTHQFFPMEIFQKDEKIDDYYWLNVCNRLDTFHPELTYPRNARGFWRPVDGEPSSYVFWTDAIGDHHAWIDKFAGSGRSGLFMSDTLVQRLQAAGLTGLSYHQEKQA